MYRLQILDAAERGLERLGKTGRARVGQRIEWLRENVDSIKPKALTGELAGLYKLREGDYRIIYQILRNEKTILIHRVGHRRDIYGRK